MPKRVQLSRRKGYRLPAGAVKVDRTGPWGNPFRVSDPDVGTAARAVELFRAFVTDPLAAFRENRAFGLATLDDCQRISSAVAQLRGKDLACWCAPDAPCHADVLLELANRGLRPVRDDG